MPAEAPTIDRSYETLLHSDRVSERTRDVLLARALPVATGGYARVLTEGERDTLSSLVSRIVPQPEAGAIDIASRIEAALAGAGDGWRFAALPPDAEAYRAGLKALGALDFAALGAAAQDEFLREIAEGKLQANCGLDATQMRRWFEDVRADAVKAYVAHPATMARIGYDGIAYGGDGERLQGFSALDPGAREDWEPLAQAGDAA